MRGPRLTVLLDVVCGACEGFTARMPCAINDACGAGLATS